MIRPVPDLWFCEPCPCHIQVCSHLWSGYFQFVWEHKHKDRYNNKDTYNRVHYWSSGSGPHFDVLCIFFWCAVIYIIQVNAWQTSKMILKPVKSWSEFKHTLIFNNNYSFKKNFFHLFFLSSSQGNQPSCPAHLCSQVTCAPKPYFMTFHLLVMMDEGIVYSTTNTAL